MHSRASCVTKAHHNIIMHRWPCPLAKGRGNASISQHTSWTQPQLQQAPPPLQLSDYAAPYPLLHAPRTPPSRGYREHPGSRPWSVQPPHTHVRMWCQCTRMPVGRVQRIGMHAPSYPVNLSCCSYKAPTHPSPCYTPLRSRAKVALPGLKH